MPDVRRSVAEELYARIAGDPHWLPEQVRRELDWSDEQFDTAVKELTGLNLLVESRTAPSGWTVLTPESAVHTLVGQAMHTSLSVLDQVAGMRRSVESLVTTFQPIHRRSVTEAQLEVLLGEAEVTAALEDATHHARYRVLSMHPGRPLPAPALSSALERDEAVLERGTEIRTLHLASAAAVPHVMDYLRRVGELGGQVRTAHLLPMWLIVIDHTLAFVALPESLRAPDGTVSAVRVRGEVLVGIFEDVFDHCWGSATPLVPRTAGPGPREPESDEPGLTERHRQVLQLLSGGLTDEAISRKLGVSERTVGRQVAELISRLDAESRFQAGVNAARLGWLEP
ncbi:LuxR C-terminal-related transcriptional regulator [Streptomyces sp. R28]|uniref:LuxR C-terminal-related transcriptional regulator n=1 Tax=Streptomyces sp. R28 TaxID=3238628 RepID=A0AB39Q0J0_9ACTN